jgi:uncharacterized protein (TIGR03083 family)
VDDRQRLSGYVAIWWGAVHSFTDLLDGLDDEDWSRPTDLPGWDVHACAAHTAHLEAILAGAPEEAPSPDLTDPATSLMSVYTEQGVVARQDRTPAELVEEIRRAAATRYERLVADPPTDGRAKPSPIFSGVSWDWQTLLRNRPLDVWMHEQDVRRAVGRPGGLDSPAAVHVVDYLAESLGYVLAKRVGAPPGTTLVLSVHGHAPVAFAVDESGRGLRMADVPTEPTVELAMDRESFVVAAGGRREPAPGRLVVTGDAGLAQRVLERLAVTP